MAKYHQGRAKGFKKSPRAQDGEQYDSGWELQYMQELEVDPLVKRWTRHHGLRIPYRKWWGGNGHFEPDFLVEIEGGDKEIREVKGTHLLADLNTKRKFQAAEVLCRERGMVFKVVTKTHVDPYDWAIRPEIKVEEAPGDLPYPSFPKEALDQTKSLLRTYQALVWIVLLLLGLYLLFR